MIGSWADPGSPLFSDSGVFESVSIRRLGARAPSRIGQPEDVFQFSINAPGQFKRILFEERLIQLRQFFRIGLAAIANAFHRCLGRLIHTPKP